MSDVSTSSPGKVSSTNFAYEYDVRAWIPTFDTTLADWAEKSQQIRSHHTVLSDLHYGSLPEETLDYFPAAPETLQTGNTPPLMIFLHGGFWRRLDKSDFSWVAPAYTAAGIAVAVMNYGLAPATCLEEMVQQVRRGIQWLYTHAAELGFNPQNISVAGHSAGGHLTCMALCTRWKAIDYTLPDTLIHSGIILSPLADLAPLAHVPVLETDLHFTPERIKTLSPVHQTLPHPIPIIAAVGGQESPEFKRQLSHLAIAWPTVQHGIIELPDDDHLSICEQFAAPDSVLFDAILNLIIPLHRSPFSSSGGERIPFE